jgi:hypothetical protein
VSIGFACTSSVATPQPADEQHALLLMLAVIHRLARFVDVPEGRADVDLVAREWDRTRPDEEVSVTGDRSRPPLKSLQNTLQTARR